MQLFIGLIRNLFRAFFRNLGKIFFVFFFSVLFIFFLFPLNELSDLASQNISKITQNQFHVEFETLKLNLFSDFGIQLGNIYFETPHTSPQTITELLALPSFSSILYKKPQGKMKLKGLLKGDVEIEITKHKEDNSSEKKIERHLISVEAARVDLKELKRFLFLPVNFSGRLDLSSKIIANLEIQEPPEIQELLLNIKNFELAQTTFEQPGGIPIDIPGIKLSEVIIKGRFFDNKLLISEMKIGKDSDEVLGALNGDINFTSIGRNNAFPMVNKYDINLDLKMKKSFYDKIYLTLSVFNAGPFFRPISGGFQFKTKISGAGPYTIPRFDAYK